MMMPVMVVMMMVVVPRAPHEATVGVAVAPVMVAHPDPTDIVDQVRLDRSRLHRRRHGH
jgi:hypothetical protein